MRSENRFDRSNLPVLAEWLEQTRFQAEVIANHRYCGDWRIGLSGCFAMPFHIIGQGGCLLKTAEGLTTLQEGDWLFFPRDTWHDLLPLPDRDSATIVLCGHIRPAEGGNSPLLDWLPDVWRYQAASGPAGDGLRLLTALFVREASGGAGVSRVILNRLCEALFAMLIRDYAEALGDSDGFLGAIRDERLSRALQAMHRDPAHPWTVEELARVAGMSRTGFALAFAAATGATPMDYLARWRMNKAISLLRQQRCSVTRVAEEVGYQSEGAFRKAFKRVTGHAVAMFR